MEWGKVALPPFRLRPVLSFSLMDTGDWITVSLTAALVGATAYYAWQNRHMVKEMAATRAVSVMPKLALEWHGVSPTTSFVKLVNVGPGPALDVDIEVVFIPKEDGDGSRPADHRRWKASVVASGEQQTFLPKDTNGGIADMEQLGNLYDRVELRGTYEDVLGNRHLAEGALDDIAGLRLLQREAHARWQHPESEQRIAEAFAKIRASGKGRHAGTIGNGSITPSKESLTRRSGAAE